MPKMTGHSAIHPAWPQHKSPQSWRIAWCSWRNVEVSAAWKAGLSGFKPFDSESSRAGYFCTQL